MVHCIMYMWPCMCKLANCIDYNESTVINTAIRNIALHACIHACSLEGTFMIACRIDYIVLYDRNSI